VLVIVYWSSNSATFHLKRVRSRTNVYALNTYEFTPSEKQDTHIKSVSEINYSRDLSYPYKNQYYECTTVILMCKNYLRLKFDKV
jgi:hypothetical protein